MDYSFCTPVSGNSTPVICQDRRNHAALGSLLVGGLAGYGAHHYGLFKEPMSADTFEKAVRSGEASNLPGLKGKDKHVLRTVEREASVVDASKFSSPKLYQKYLWDEHKVTSIAELEGKIKEIETAVGSDAMGDIAKQSQGKIDGIRSLQGLSQKLEEVEKELAGFKGKLPRDEAIRYSNLQSSQSNLKLQLAEQMKSAGIIDKDVATIKVPEGSAKIKNVDGFINSHPEVRSAFFDERMKVAMQAHDVKLNRIQGKTDKLTKLQTDLHLARAAEANGGMITEEIAKEANATIGELIGKGEKGIAKAFKATEGKLLAGNNLKKAGLLGGLVALGLYCFSS